MQNKNLQTLKEIEEDYVKVIAIVHDQVIADYQELCSLRNKLKDIRELIKEIINEQR